MNMRSALQAYRFEEMNSIARPLGGLAMLLLLVTLLCLLPVGCAVSSSSAALPSSQQANQAATSTGVVPSTFFGMVVKSSSHTPTVATGSRRLWDSGVTWASLEPSEGNFSWQTLDQEVASSEAAGAEVTLTLGMTPTWASSQPSVPSLYGAGATAAPRNISTWDAYLLAVASRYKGRIANYEVWNDPSDPQYWAGAVTSLGADMALLTTHAAAVIHAADPAAKVVAPALDADGMRLFLAAGGNTAADTLTVSLSLAGQAPEALVPELAAVRAAMNDSQAQTKPLWNDQPSWTLPEGLAGADQAGYVARSLILNASFGISRLAWYAWDEGNAGALRLSDANAQPTAAAGAYSVVEEWLANAQVNGCAANAEQVWTCQVIRNGEPAWILWSTAGTQPSSSLGMSTITDLSGTERALDQSGWVSVSGSPVLLQ